MPTSSHPSIAEMQKDIGRLLPSLSRSQANVLGEMVFAILMVDGCGITRMCSYLSALLGQATTTLRQKYREMYYEKEAKVGVKQGRCKRRELVVEELFADLLGGVLKDWQGPKTLVLALDASTLSDRLTVLSISVMYRGCGIRVAWTILPAAEPGAWRPHWERMLKLLAPAVPAEWQVLGLADRGLYAAWLFSAIQAHGWHPFLRVKQGLSFQAEGEGSFQAIGTRVKRLGREWKGVGRWSETGEPMQGTGWVRWERGYEEPICVVSDLPLTQAKTAWYQWRFWIEDEYKDGKRGWFHWEQSKMTKPQRAARLWLVLAIAMQKAILVGGALEAQEQQAQRKHRRHHSQPQRRGRPSVSSQRPRGREQSVLMRGVMAMRAKETGGKLSLPAGQVRSEPLPRRLYGVSRVCRSYQRKHQRREEKKRSRQRARSKVKREQRAAQQAAKQARRQEKQARREAKHAAELARRQERPGRRAAQPAGLLTDGPAKPAIQQAPTSVPQKPGGNEVGHRPLRERCAELSLPPASDAPQQGSGQPAPAGA